MEKKLIGTKELAKYLDVSIGTIYSWVWQKKLPHYKVGRLVKFDLKEIESWIKERRVKEIRSKYGTKISTLC